MKTIKELVEMKPFTHYKAGYWSALKDVLGLIDEVLPWSTGREELKKRITG